MRINFQPMKPQEMHSYYTDAISDSWTSPEARASTSPCRKIRLAVRWQSETQSRSWSGGPYAKDPPVLYTIFLLCAGLLGSSQPSSLQLGQNLREQTQYCVWTLPAGVWHPGPPRRRQNQTESRCYGRRTLASSLSVELASVKSLVVGGMSRETLGPRQLGRWEL